jgi:DNA gyrase inhibitor GyrI
LVIADSYEEKPKDTTYAEFDNDACATLSQKEMTNNEEEVMEESFALSDLMPEDYLL